MMQTSVLVEISQYVFSNVYCYPVKNEPLHLKKKSIT